MVMTQSGWDEERAAAEIVGAQLGAAAMEKRDVPGAPSGTHDYDIHIGDRVIALEVTSATDGDVRSLWDTVHDQEWEAPSLGRSWGLTLKPGSRTKGLAEKALPFLRTLEAGGVEKFDDSYPSRLSSDGVLQAQRQLSELGIRNGISMDSKPTRIVVSVIGPSGWGSADTLTYLVERAAQRKVEQLGRATAEERHVFLWLDWSDYDAQAAMHFVMDLGVLPKSPPALPEGIDKVWVMPFAVSDGRSRPLLSATVEKWEVVSRGEE